jgi:hypothetical protein
MADAWGTVIVKNRSNLRINISPSVNNYGDALGVNQERDTISQKTNNSTSAKRNVRLDNENRTDENQIITRIEMEKSKTTKGGKGKGNKKGEWARGERKTTVQEVPKLPNHTSRVL